MIKNIIQLTIMSIILYYSFIDVIPVLYWITTGLYILVGLVATVFAYGLDTKASWISSKEAAKLQATLASKSKLIFTIINIVIITLVLIYTSNYYHLLYPLTLVGLWSSIYNYSK